ncbi:MAG: histidine kinase [Ilumatobacteraceae bacterium]
MSNHEPLPSSPPLRRAGTLMTATQDRNPRLERLPSADHVHHQTAESQQALRSEACATAVAFDRERIADGLHDSVIHRLFTAGLQLQSTCQVVDALTRDRIETTIALLDDTIAELRKAIFSLH